VGIPQLPKVSLAGIRCAEVGRVLDSMISNLSALWRTPAAVYLGASVLARAGSLLLIPLYTRRLTLEEYGNYALFLTLLVFLSTFISAGLVSAIPTAYFSQKDRAEGKYHASEVARWTAVFSIGAALVLLVGVECFAPEDSRPLLGRSALRLAVLGATGRALSVVPPALLRSEQRAYSAAAFQLLQFVTMTAAGLVLVLILDRGYRGAIEAAAGAPLVSGVASLFYIQMLPKSGMRFDRLRAALRFSMPFLPHFVAQWLLGAADLWILGKAGFEQELGGYSLAAQVIVPVTMVITAWNEHMGPEMGEHFRTGGIPEIRRHLPRARLSYFLAALVPSVAVLLSTPLIAWLIGPKFEPAIAFVPFLLLAALPNALYFSDFQVVYYAGRSRWIGRATITAAGISVVLGFVLIPPFGAYGALVSRIAGASIRALIVVYFAGKVGEMGPARRQP
jgi:O-antigen/teichoic acid export membrane protein